MKTHINIFLVCFSICIFLLSSGFQSSVISEGEPGPNPSWMDGSWEGVGYQLNSNTTWTIKLDVDVSKKTYEIEYPSLECGGYWYMSSANKHKAIFTEKITDGIFRCVNQGTVVITLIDENYITFTYFSPYDGSLEAHSTLKRVVAPDS